MLGKLEYLLALAREKNFGRAADSLGIAQPSFSAGIKALEDTLGMPLVIRSSRFQGFTPEGLAVLEWARRITGDVHAMRDDVTRLKRGLTGLLRIAAVPTALATISDLTTPYRARHPNVRFSILSCPSSEVLERLTNLDIDAGITYLDNESTGRARSFPLYDERYRLLTAATAKLGDRASVTWGELGQIPLCLLTPDMQNRRTNPTPSSSWSATSKPAAGPASCRKNSPRFLALPPTSARSPSPVPSKSTASAWSSRTATRSLR
jgi:DNA-binding transcriptional LysR family regulator